MYPTYFAPNGEDVQGISPDEIETLLLEKGSDYWAVGSGDAAVRFSDGAEGEIVFIVREPTGVFVQFVETQTHEQWALSNGADETATVTIRQGGQSWELPRAFFVDKRTAIEAIKCFVATGKKPAQSNWVLF